MGRFDFSAWKLIIGLLMVVGVWGCAKPAPRTVVVTVGGMGFSQMHDLRDALAKECPEARVVSAGMWDAYKTDIKQIVEAEPRTHVILIGHSFGCAAIDDAAEKLPEVDLAIFIDPAWDDFKISRQIDRYMWFKRSNIDIEREANIIGADSPATIKGGHNEIPHSPELISAVVAEVKRIEGPEAVAKNTKDGKDSKSAPDKKGTAVADAAGGRGTP